MSPLHETHRRFRFCTAGAETGTRRAAVRIPGVINVRVTSMFARRRAPEPCIRRWLLGRLHCLQIGAITQPILAMYTCPPTSARLLQLSNEHRPRRRPVAFSASRIHEPLCASASELPSTFQALIASSKTKTSPDAMRSQQRDGACHVRFRVNHTRKLQTTNPNGVANAHSRPLLARSRR